tara:strand:- start:410 stop:589 length:180 start_codon:yes stop_codon:yes gene_type:complete
MNWINSWNARNKKERYRLDLRVGTLTVFEFMFCPCEVCDNKKVTCSKLRLMIFNFGFEL